MNMFLHYFLFVLTDFGDSRDEIHEPGLGYMLVRAALCALKGANQSLAGLKARCG